MRTRGSVTVHRLAVRIVSSPSIWPRRIEQMLTGIPCCHCIFDDILITRPNDVEHLHIIEQVHRRLSENIVRYYKRPEISHACRNIVNTNNR